MAYKSRVPVRGAILLNEAMDEVVLVKGWKKSANWSFPRGKINQGENDLDCAVREVYEETGFDARQAGLIQDEKDMKYIEISMREQHMRLYVFRGVPRDTYFEPKTRKEISKIDWYKLTDLPTLKKNKQHEGSGTDHVAINANKFYMVAPFLVPLKKWITQQRKKENRYSSHLAAPPMMVEELTTEEERDTDGLGARLAEPAPPVVSDLPEVSVHHALDPTSHLKEMLQIGMQPVQSQPVLQSTQIQQVDPQKSNALLALLRGNQQSHRPVAQSTVPDPIATAFDVRQSPHVSYTRNPELDRVQRSPQFQRPLPQDQAQPTARSFFGDSQERVVRPGGFDHFRQPAPPIAPYQRVGDPLAVPQGQMYERQAAVPPASALPKLTNHTKALLDVFKGPLGSQIFSILPVETESQETFPTADALRPSSLREQDPVSTLSTPYSATQVSSSNLAPFARSAVSRPAANARLEAQVNSAPPPRQVPNAQKTSLLQLFNRPSTPIVASSATKLPAPVELAATAAYPSAENPKVNKDELLLALLRQGHVGLSRKEAEAKRPFPREGETSATINGPLNQPEFEVVSRTTKHTSNELGRSPVTANRTLFDPNAPAPVKILTRPEEGRPQPPRSPRGIKPTSKRTVKDKMAPKDQPKPFQPQILRRPQAVEAAMASVLPLREEATAQEPNLNATATALPIVSNADTFENLAPSRKASHTDNQKQKLLSLFSGGLDTTPKAIAVDRGSGIVSPLTASQLLGSNAETSFPGIEPISTRTSRVGSMTSIAGGIITGRAAAEKRQTGAENKAFLLGYLGRIATQEK